MFCPSFHNSEIKFGDAPIIWNELPDKFHSACPVTNHIYFPSLSNTASDFSIVPVQKTTAILMH